MSRAGRGGRSAALVVAGILLLLFLVTVAGQLAPSVKGGATFKCAVEGPNSLQAEVSERSDRVVGRLVAVPIGRACEWRRADGQGTVTTYSGSWPWTLVSYGLAALSLTVAALAISRNRARSPASVPARESPDAGKRARS